VKLQFHAYETIMKLRWMQKSQLIHNEEVGICFVFKGNIPR